MNNNIRQQLLIRVFQKLKYIVIDGQSSRKLTDDILLKLAAVLLPQNEVQAILDQESSNA